MQLTVVHPCYNEQENIAQTVRETLAWMDSEGMDGEVIVVDDGSTDQSPRILRELSEHDARVQSVTHTNNRGYGIAVRSGCDAATKEYVAFMDSDGQFHIKDLGLLIPHLTQYDFVPGRRRNRADPLIRNLFGKVLGFLNLCFFGMWIRDVNCGMKIFKRSLWLVMRPEYGTEKFFNTELYLRLKRAGIAWKQVDVPHYPRRAGSPTGGSVRVIVHMFRELVDLRCKLRDRKSKKKFEIGNRKSEIG